MITPDQIRAARALKNWSQAELAERAGVATPSIANIELGKQKPSAQMLEAIKNAFENEGLEFLPNEGVHKKTSSVKIFNGRDGFEKFMNDVDNTAEKFPDSTFLVTNVDEDEFVRWQDHHILDAHTKNILKNNVRYKIIIEEHDTFMPASPYAEYRWITKEHFYSVPLYIYGDKVGFISFEEHDVNVFIVQNPIFSDLCRKQFNEMWEKTFPISQKNKKKIK